MLDSNVGTFQAKLGCDNCGHMGLYTIPLKNVIEPYDFGEPNSYSYYRPSGRNTETVLRCANCQLPQLEVFYRDTVIPETAKVGDI